MQKSRYGAPAARTSVPPSVASGEAMARAKQMVQAVTAEPVVGEIYEGTVKSTTAFGAFIEGAAGFGTPVAVAAAMLTGLGFSPFYAAAICLLAKPSPVAFGSIGTPLVA